MQITDLIRYPVKGLGGEHLEKVVVEVGATLPLDRQFAITHGDSKFDFINPEWIARRNFTVVAHSPIVGTIECQYDQATERLILQAGGKTLLDACITTHGFNDLLTDALRQFVVDGQPGPYELVSVPQINLTDSPTQTISLMNTRSLENLQSVVEPNDSSGGISLDKRRFRGNLWFEGAQPWEELDWIGKTITIDDVQLRVTEKIERCAAIDACPVKGVRDIELLKTLNQQFGHVYFGVLAEVVQSGSLMRGSELQVNP